MKAMKSKGKKLITWLLMAAMVITTVPGYVFAAENDAATVSEAVEQTTEDTDSTAETDEETTEAETISGTESESMEEPAGSEVEVKEEVTEEALTEAEEADTEDVELLGEDGNVTKLTKASYEATELKDNAWIYVACDTEIHIGAGVSKTIAAITNESNTPYKLTISGDETGTLNISQRTTFNYAVNGNEDKKLTISGGTINCKEMFIGNTCITGGVINTDRILAPNVALSVSGGEINVHNREEKDWPAIQAGSFTVSGGEINAVADVSDIAIWCGTACSITGGVVNATALADGSMGINCNKQVIISGDAYVTALGEAESVYTT